MPIYSYCCSTCHYEKDILQKISDPLLTLCPECNNHTLRKKVTAAGFQLKGSGWYVTDFRNPPKSKEKTDNKKSSGTQPTQETKNMPPKDKYTHGNARSTSASTQQTSNSKPTSQN
jgi:putative FmdB family regulatory protein